MGELQEALQIIRTVLHQGNTTQTLRALREMRDDPHLRGVVREAVSVVLTLEEEWKRGWAP